MMIGTLSHERLLALLHYDPDTGHFTRLKRERGDQRGVGARAGKRNPHRGYRDINVDGRTYKEHRLAWFYVHRAWPNDQIDHINRVRDDNRIANLREATNSENHWNTAPHRRNTSGFKGVSFDKSMGKWHAQICRDYQNRRLGYFDTPEEAHAAYLAAARDLHGAFVPVTEAGV